jgi:LmbE family N-acetylglucosaminyl deacetylase
MPDSNPNPGPPVKVHRKKRNLFFLIIGVAILLIAGYYGFTTLILPGVLPQQAINLMPEVPIPQTGQKVLIFSPHPDDETIATGGYIAQAIQQGADVRIVLVTDGNKHGKGVVRYAEFRKATAILGVNASSLVFMGLPDGGLNELGETTLYQLLKEQVDSYNPDIIIYPAHQDFHPDHAIVGKEMDKIVGGYSNVVSFTYLVHYGWEYPRPKKLAPTLYLLPPTRLLIFGNAWQKVMLPQTIEPLKQEAIYAYQSQLTDPVLKDLLLSNIRQNELLLAH